MKAKLTATRGGAKLKAQIAKARQMIEKPLPPDPDGHNEKRAEWAAHALDTFADATGLTDEDKDCALGDLLCDLMHWCDRQPVGIEFNTALQNARTNYNEETADE